TVPVAPAAFSVWQPLQPADAKTALPATGSPCTAGVAAVVVGAGVELAVVVCATGPVASLLSFPNTSTAAIIATKKAMQSTTYQPRPRLPGKSGLRRVRRNDETSAKTMNAIPTAARPILWPADRPAATTSIVESIGAGSYRNYPSDASPAVGSASPVSGGPAGSGWAGRRYSSS